MVRPQKTLRTAVELSGQGLHSGERVDVRILPAPLGTGIEFVRTDLPDSPPIPASIRYHSEKDRRTTPRAWDLGGRDRRAPRWPVCSGLQVDNLRVELSGQELPGMDGSAEHAGRALPARRGPSSSAPRRRTFRLEQPLYVRDGPATLVALPAENPGLTLQYIASFADPEIEGGSFQMEVTPESFENEIAPARTFCLASEVEAPARRGLRQGRDAGEHGRPRRPRDRVPDAATSPCVTSCSTSSGTCTCSGPSCTRTSSRRAPATRPTPSSSGGSSTSWRREETGGLLRSARPAWTCAR